MSDQPTLTLEAGANNKLYWKELWAKRELALMLAQRDFLLRFKQTYMGLAWILMRPALLMAVLLFVFGTISGFNKDSAVPYALIVLTGLIPWQYFSLSVAEVSKSLHNNQHILSKTYFPRLVLPLSALGSNTADFCMSFILLGACYAWYGYTPGWQIILLPVFLLATLLLIVGIGLWISALSVKFRDLLLLLPFGLQLGLYISPVGYGAGRVPPEYWWLYNLNPMVGILEGFRWCLLNGQGGFHWKSLLVSLIAGSLLVITGIRQFRKTERTIADII